MKKSLITKMLVLSFICMSLSSCAMLSQIGRGFANALVEVANMQRQVTSKRYYYKRSTYVRSTSTHCFIATTKVVMADGSLKAIGEIELGDMVMSFPENNARYGKPVPKPVVAIFRTPNVPVCKAGGLITTPGHDFVSPDGKFMDVDKLKEAVAMDGKAYPIQCSEVFKKATVYNLAVEGNPTYIVVGTRKWRVHNRSTTK